MFARFKAFCLVVCFLALVGTASAQTNTATITGTVSDASGAAVVGAMVTATSAQTGAQTTETTAENGRYTIGNLAPGSYDVQASQQGFSTVIRRNQEFLVGKTVTLDFAMQVASVAQTVEVTSSAPVIDTTQSVLSRVLEPTEVDSLPVFTRGFTSLATLTPGVYIVPSTTASAGGATGGNVQIGPASTWSTGFVLDGNSISKVVSGGTILNVAQDWIEEFSVVTQQASAEYSFASAGFVNAVTKSGGNDIHGRAYGYFQNAVLNAEPGLLPKSVTGKPSYDQQRIGGLIGGPIKKDKLFYFVGYEYLHALNSVNVNVPAAFTTYNGANIGTGVFPQPITTHIGMLKLDYKINDKNTIHLASQIEHDLDGNASVGATAATITTLSGGGTTFNQATNSYATWDDVISPNILNEVRFQTDGMITDIGSNYVNSLPPYSSISGSAPVPGAITYWGDPTGYYARQVYTAAQVTFGPATLWGTSGERDWFGSDTVTVNRGNHTVKFGLSAGNRGRFLPNYHVYTDGQYTFANGLAPFNPATLSTSVFPTTGNCALSCYPTAYIGDIVPNNADTGGLPDPFVGIFVQDSWKATNRLTLNMGIRWDMDFANGYFTPPPAPAGQDRLNLPNNDSKDFAPRVGFAWTPFHDSGNTVVRGGVGIYYDSNHSNFGANYIQNDAAPVLLGGLPEVLNISYNSVGGNPYCVLGIATCTTSVPTAYQKDVEEILAYALATNTVPNFNPTGGTIKIGPNTYTVPTFNQIIPPSLLNADPDYRNGGQLQATMGLARQFGAWSVSGDFVYLDGFNQYMKRNGNITPTGAAINPTYGLLQTMSYAGRLADYSMHAQASYRDHRGDSMNVSYALQYAYDNYPGSGGFTPGVLSAGNYSTDPFNANLDWGRSGVVPTDILTISGVGRIPFGFYVAPIFGYNTGLYQDPTTAARSGSLVASCPVYYAQCWPALGPNGTYLKDTFATPADYKLDIRVSKKINFGEKRSATLFFEAYNVTNHSNYTTFNMNYTTNGSTVNTATYGLPTAMNTKRQLQLGGEFDF